MINPKRHGWQEDNWNCPKISCLKQNWKRVKTPQKKKKAEEYKLLSQASGMVYKVIILAEQVEVMIDSGLGISLLRKTFLRN